MAKIFQEFYCTTSGGGCGGYFIVPININLNGVVEMICPKCQHPHQRFIVNGEIRENGRHSSQPIEQIVCTMAAYSEKSRSGFSAKTRSERDGKVISRAFLQERRFELYGVV